MNDRKAANSPESVGGSADVYTFVSESEEATQRLGAALAAVLPPGAVVSLVGTLGAGKTRLVQAIAEACGVPRESVTSPTFVLCNEYQGSRTICHFDAYRVANLEEFRDLGAEEYFDSDGLVLIEWGDRVAGALPEERVEIRIAVTGPDGREFKIQSSDPRVDIRKALATALVAGG